MWNEISADSTIIEKFHLVDYVSIDIDFVMGVLIYIYGAIKEELFYNIL